MHAHVCASDAGSAVAFYNLAMLPALAVCLSWASHPHLDCGAHIDVHNSRPRFVALQLAAKVVIVNLACGQGVYLPARSCLSSFRSHPKQCHTAALALLAHSLLPQGAR